MQTSKEEIMAQQLIMAFLGFYRGVIDGIWSGASISAMQAFECSDLFAPAVPTFGLPFPLNARLPKGMRWHNRLVTHVRLSPDAAETLLKSRQAYVAPAPVVADTPAPEPTVTQEPEFEMVVADEPEKVVQAEPVLQEEPTVTPPTEKPAEEMLTLPENPTKAQRREFYQRQQEARKNGA